MGIKGCVTKTRGLWNWDPTGPVVGAGGQILSLWDKERPCWLTLENIGCLGGSACCIHCIHSSSVSVST